MDKFKELENEISALSLRLFLTPEINAELKQLRDNFEAEAEEATKQIQMRYMQLEIDYIKSLMGKMD